MGACPLSKSVIIRGIYGNIYVFKSTVNQSVDFASARAYQFNKGENKFQSERGAQLLIAFKVKALSLSLVGGIQIVDHRGN